MPSQLTLKAAAPQYLEHLRTAGKNEHTVRTYGKALEVIAGFFGDPRHVDAVGHAVQVALGRASIGSVHVADPLAGRGRPLAALARLLALRLALVEGVYHR